MTDTGEMGRRLEVLADALRRGGFGDINAFLDAHPAATYVELARLLGPTIAGMDVAICQMEDAQRKGTLREAAADGLVRELRNCLPGGWIPGPAGFDLARAYGAWAAHLKVEARRPDLSTEIAAVFAALLKSNPPEGWLPASKRDPLLAQAFDTGWPQIPESMK